MKPISLMLFSLIAMASNAQLLQRDCPVNMRKNAPANIDSVLLARQGRTLNQTLSVPFTIRLFVVVFANDDGTNAAAGNADIERQIDNMQRFYYPHGICFILANIQQVNSSDLNSMNVDSEEDELSPYIRSNFITIFIHANLVDGKDVLNGNAYGIPNNYLSISGDAVASESNISTLAHEMGHCFGLYHTFETAHGEENVNRSGGCKNCENNGDYLCDTEADFDPVDGSFINSDCEYTGSRRDACASIYKMDLENIMTYGRRSCRMRFSTGQGNRARGFIQAESDLTDAVAADDLVLTIPLSYSSGSLYYLAKNTITFQSTLSYTQTVKVRAIAKAIVVKPGTVFRPSSGGYALLQVNQFCN